MSATAEPSRADLAAIEAEWPVIAAELAITDAEIAAARSGGVVTELERRRWRRAQHVRTRALAELVTGRSGLADAGSAVVGLVVLFAVIGLALYPLLVAVLPAVTP